MVPPQVLQPAPVGRLRDTPLPIADVAGGIKVTYIFDNPDIHRSAIIELGLLHKRLRVNRAHGHLHDILFNKCKKWRRLQYRP
jgi:hypothetical protein